MVISFSEKKMGHVTSPQDGALVITIGIDRFNMKRVLVDSGSSADVLFLGVYKKMERKEKELKNVNFSLMGLALHTTYPVGVVILRVHLREG